MPPPPLAPPAQPSPSARRTWGGALIVGLLAFAWLAHDRGAESFFLDESSYIAQSYAFDLLAAGRLDDPAWLAEPALDQPPLFKYLIGLALRVGGHRRPGPEVGLAWHRDHNLRPIRLDEKFFANRSVLDAARWPSLVLGVLGCVSLYGLGVLLRDARVGALAAFLLAANPLYRQQALRALNDVPCEALVLASAAVALWAWRRSLLGWFVPALRAWPVAGVLGGLAVLAKLTGLIVLLHVAAWSALALLLATSPRSRRAGVVVGAMTFTTAVAATFLVGNPTMTAHPRGPLDPETQAVARQGPVGRALAMVRSRIRLAALQQEFYPHYALSSLPQKAGIAAVQGFGRFSPFGPAHSNLSQLYDWTQDRWGLVWMPWVASGAAVAASLGRRQWRNGQPPTAWAILAGSVITLACVVGYLPMAWDRYLLSIQPWNALLAALAAVAALDVLARRFGGKFRVGPGSSGRSTRP